MGEAGAPPQPGDPEAVMRRGARLLSLPLASLLSTYGGASSDGANPPDSPDPALEVIEKLLAELKEKRSAPPTTAPASAQSPVPEPIAPPAEPAGERKPIDPISPRDAAPSVRPMLDEVGARGAEADAKRVRNAALLLEQARAAEKAGKLAEALRLAGSARRLDPKNAEIASYVSALSKLAGEAPASSGVGKAAAHLAAGLTRGQILMERNRFEDAADILAGVVRAADLFPADANVAIYKRLALRELEGYKSKVESGLVSPADARGAPPTPQEEPELVATGSAAPDNARRLLRSVEGMTPNWYAQAKNRLAFRMSVNYTGIPAALVFEDVARQTGANVVVDEPVLRSRAHLNARIDLRVSDVPAETILSLACQTSGLEYVIVERAVVITTPARALRYLQDLPEALRDNWAAARVIFPDLNPELLAAPPLPSALPGQPVGDRAELDRDVPAYLRSGDALFADVQSLLR
jgi:tetratricopeptide (TPR) repeat protein